MLWFFSKTKPQIKRKVIHLQTHILHICMRLQRKTPQQRYKVLTLIFTAFFNHPKVQTQTHLKINTNTKSSVNHHIITVRIQAKLYEQNTLKLQQSIDVEQTMFIHLLYNSSRDSLAATTKLQKSMYKTTRHGDRQQSGFKEN
jgi:hypothetical protein